MASLYGRERLGRKLQGFQNAGVTMGALSFYSSSIEPWGISQQPERSGGLRDIQFFPREVSPKAGRKWQMNLKLPSHSRVGSASSLP